MSDAYRDDFYAWTRLQSSALRGRAGPNVLDWDNLAEEIESLGASLEKACESYLCLIIEHLLKIQFVGTLYDMRGWRKELRAFRRNLSRRMSPSLRAALSKPEKLDELYADAARGLIGDLADDGVEVRLPDQRPYDWNDLLGRGDNWTPEPRQPN